MQFNEYYNERTGLTVGIKKKLFSEKTPFQLVEVFETDTWGNMMTIDGMVMLSEKDEFVYHEMISHVGMFAHPDPRRVLIIGGGDGGTAREVLKHPSVERVDMVEIDEAVVRAAKEFLPGVGAFDNPRLHVHYDDGIRFVKEVKDPYDVIIIDGSDPVGPAVELFSNDFYKSCHNALTENGVLTAQTESPWVASYHPAIRNLFSALDATFRVSEMYLAFIPLYPAGMWSLAFASQGIHPHDPEVMKRVEEGTIRMGSSLRYYNRDIHRGAFALPGFVRDILR
ncbi:polyamine aminopropyltransferase [Balneolales bacterium ANBcel1]|nr:polyamine aminopropyltransferase [Balneolales bacterium ANBcel1]